MVGDEGEDGVVAGVIVRLVTGDEDGEVVRGCEPDDGVPHGVAAGMGEGGTSGPGLVVGDDPAHGVFRVAGGRGVELLEGFGFDQFGFGRGEAGGGEFGPVSDGAVDDAGGSDGDGVVGGGAGLDRRAVGFVAAGLVVLRRRAGCAEASGRHAEGTEDLFASEVFPGFAGDLLGHVAGDGEAGVGVDVLLAGSGFWRFRRDALEEESARAGGRTLVLPEFPPQLILFELTGCAAAVGEELFQRDGLVLSVDGFLELGESLAEGLIPFQFSFIDKDPAEHGGDRLGVGADVEAVGGGDLVRLAARADASRAEGDGLAVADDGGGHAGYVVLLDDGGKESRDVLRRRGRGVDADGSKAEQGESDGENGFHTRVSGLWLVKVQVRQCLITSKFIEWRK